MDVETIFLKRNKLMNRIMWLCLIFSMIGNSIAEFNLTVFLSLFFIGGTVCTVTAIFNYKKIYLQPTMYLNMTASVLFIWYLVMIQPHIMNFIFFFFALSIGVLYQNKKIVAYTFLLVAIASIHIFYFSGFRDIIFYNSLHSDGIFLMSCMFFVALIAFGQAHQSEQLRIASERHATEAVDHSVKTEKTLIQMKENAQAVEEFSMMLNENITLTTQLSNELMTSFREMANAFELQSDSTLEMKHATESVDSDIIVVNGSAEDMSELSSETLHTTETGNNQLSNLENELYKVSLIVDENVNVMNELNASTERIGSIIDVLNQIANRTTLLSLNASIEAARAGENGRGFSIVAEEVKKLSEHSKHSITEITNIIEDLKEKTKKASAGTGQGKDAITVSSGAMAEAKTAFTQITVNTSKVTQEATKIARLVENLKVSSHQIVNQITNNSAITQENSASLRAIIELFEKQNQQVSDIAMKFKQLESRIKNFNKDEN